MAGLDDVLERLVTDPAFRIRLVEDRAGALAGYDLSVDDLALLGSQLSEASGASGAMEGRTTKAGMFGLLGGLDDVLGAVDAGSGGHEIPPTEYPSFVFHNISSDAAGAADTHDINLGVGEMMEMDLRSQSLPSPAIEPEAGGTPAGQSSPGGLAGEGAAASGLEVSWDVAEYRAGDASNQAAGAGQGVNELSLDDTPGKEKGPEPQDDQIIVERDALGANPASSAGPVGAGDLSDWRGRFGSVDAAAADPASSGAPIDVTDPSVEPEPGWVPTHHNAWQANQMLEAPAVETNPAIDDIQAAEPAPEPGFVKSWSTSGDADDRPTEDSGAPDEAGDLSPPEGRG